MNNSSFLSQSSSLIVFEPNSYRIPSDRLILKKGENVDESLLCGICQEVPFRPEECTTCQNLFCSECITNWKEKKNQCPFNCPSPITLVKPHKIIKQALCNLIYSCINKPLGCEAVISLENLAKHEKNCDYSKITCDLCKEETLRKEMGAHTIKCEYVKILCNKCGFELIKKDLPEHDCIKTLVKRQNDFEIQFKNYKEFAEKTMENLIQKITELELKAPEKNKNISSCPKGHNLYWNPMGEELAECSLCKRKHAFSRLKCQPCNLAFCTSCKYPDLTEKQCPWGHKLALLGNPRWHSCDLCRAELVENSQAWRDVSCDFDVCNACLIKASKN